MSPTSDDFTAELASLRGELATQGKRVRDLVEAALDAFFAADNERAAEAIASDEQIDAADVAIEQAAVDLLSAVAKDANPIKDAGLRGVLNLVKINNEYERIADAGVTVAESVIDITGNTARLPITARVMTNSVVGILRDVVKAYNTQDATLARLVLQSEAPSACSRPRSSAPPSNRRPGRHARRPRVRPPRDRQPVPPHRRPLHKRRRAGHLRVHRRHCPPPSRRMDRKSRPRSGLNASPTSSLPQKIPQTP